MKLLVVIIALALAADLFDRGWTFYPWMLLYGVFNVLWFEPARRAMRRWWRANRRADPSGDFLTYLSRSLIGWPKLRSAR